MANGIGMSSPSGLTSDALAQRINSLSGGAPLPQADTMAIANRLLGPDLAQRYGDVIGARPTSVRDIARDFSLGALSGDPFKADELKARVVQSYNDEMRKEDAAARARDEEQRARMSAFFDGLKSVQSAPEEAKASLLKYVFRTTTGDEPDATTIKLFLADESKALADFMASPEIYQVAQDQPEEAIRQITAVSKDPVMAQKVVDGLQKMKREHEETQSLILDRKRKKIALRDADSLDRKRFIARLAGKTIKERGGRTRLLTPDEIESMADRFFPRAATPSAADAAAAPPPLIGLPQAPAAAPAPEEGSTTFSPTTSAVAQTTTPTPAAAPAGIPQAPSPSAAAAAAPQKVRRITGTVTRLE